MTQSILVRIEISKKEIELCKNHCDLFNLVSCYTDNARKSLIEEIAAKYPNLSKEN